MHVQFTLSHVSKATTTTGIDLINSSQRSGGTMSSSSLETNNPLLSFGNTSSVYGNSTESVSGDNILRMCTHDSMERCYSDFAWKYLVAAVNIISLFVNIFHIIILRRLPAIRGTPYSFVLQQISVADIYAIMSMGQIFCIYHKLYINKNIMIGVLFVTFHEHCGLVRFNVLAVASIERYLSLCHPLGGESVCFIVWSRARKVKLIAAVFWIAALVFSFLKHYLSRNELCVWAFYGPSTKASTGSSVMMCSYIAIITLIIVVCNFKVLRELKKVASRNKQSDRDQVAKRTVYYILIINVAYYICLLPVGAVIIMGPLGHGITKVRWFIHILYSSYGVFNVVIYGLVMKPYRTVISAIFQRSSKDVPQQRCVSTTNIPKHMEGNNCSTATTCLSVSVVSKVER